MPQIDEKIFDTYKHMNSRKSVDWFSWWVLRKLNKETFWNPFEGLYMMLLIISIFFSIPNLIYIVHSFVYIDVNGIIISILIETVLIFALLLGILFSKENFLREFQRANESYLIDKTENGIKKRVYMSIWYYMITPSEVELVWERERNSKRKHWTNTEVTNRVLSLWEFYKLQKGKLSAQKKLEMVKDIEEFQNYYDIK